jgi:hypothetical protein
MSSHLTAGVVVRHPGSGTVIFLPEGSDLPEWAEALVGDHVLTAQTVAADTVTAEPPPKAGPGSSRARWVEYAAANGIAVTDDETRDEIIAACEAAGVPTD